MAFVNGYDPDKAQAYNELRQSSPNLNNTELLSQAGISSTEAGYYRPSPIGYLVENPTPTNVNTTIFAPSGTLVTAANFQIPQTLSSPTNTQPYVPAADNGFRIPEGVYDPTRRTAGLTTVEDQKLNVFANPVNPSVEPQGTTITSDYYRQTNFQAPNLEDPASGVNLGGLITTQEQSVQREQAQFLAQQDWRFRISLAPGSTYLYNDPEARSASHILNPLNTTQGVIFPYVPQVSVSYNANYEPTDVAHTNYRIYQYKNSNVGEISISGEFTAQDTFEANYLLAVIHFFKSVTKMFYGGDENPIRGTPPPLCYLSGFGQYQFNYHPVAITSFSYSLPSDVDYIKAGVIANMGGTNIETQINSPKNILGGSSIGTLLSSFFRLKNAGLTPGARSSRPVFQRGEVSNPTYVPTKIQIQIGCIPIISRFAMANAFSLKQYASGRLSVGSNKSDIGGIW